MSASESGGVGRKGRAGWCFGVGNGDGGALERGLLALLAGLGGATWARGSASGGGFSLLEAVGGGGRGSGGLLVASLAAGCGPAFAVAVAFASPGTSHQGIPCDSTQSNRTLSRRKNPLAPLAGSQGAASNHTADTQYLVASASPPPQSQLTTRARRTCTPKSTARAHTRPQRGARRGRGRRSRASAC